MIPLLFLRGLAGSVVGFWRALPGPIQALILIVAAGIAGILWGEHAAAKRCEARIQASIAAAQNKDVEIARDAKARAERARGDAEVRSATVTKEVRGYVEEMAQQTVAACLAGRDADRLNDGLDVHDDAVPAARAKPAPGRGRGAVPGAVPERSGK